MTPRPLATAPPRVARPPEGQPRRGVGHVSVLRSGSSVYDARARRAFWLAERPTLEKRLAALWASQQTERWLESLKIRVVEIEKRARETAELVQQIKRENEALRGLPPAIYVSPEERQRQEQNDRELHEALARYVREEIGGTDDRKLPEERVLSIAQDLLGVVRRAPRADQTGKEEGEERT
jgi:hypothetical protein